MKPELHYVVLHHTGIAEPHFDLMLETSPDDLLATWRLNHWPPEKGDEPQPIADHRREYLEYEGKLSGERGEVKRVAHGVFKTLDMSQNSQKIQLDIEFELVLSRTRSRV